MGHLTQIKNWSRSTLSYSSVEPLYWKSDSFPSSNDFVLPRGLGRSYGDSCLNSQNTVVPTTNLNRFINFDYITGILTCESGVSLKEILEQYVPHGWFLSVVPGTESVTVGGAIANDVHGKNFHLQGSFGNTVQSFLLLRSDQEHVLCSPNENSDLFHATIGGLGLTGIILWAQIKLRPVLSTFIDQHSFTFQGLDEFLKLSKSHETDFEYTSAWVGKNLKGVFFAGNHSKSVVSGDLAKPPFFDAKCLPSALLNRTTVNIFNYAYYYFYSLKRENTLSHYSNFLFPLDRVKNWNLLYGKKGFLQYQCIIPYKEITALQTILDIAENKSFLTVLKNLGHRKSLGILSFPRPGVTISMDFPIAKLETPDVLRRLNELILKVGGTIYPAKDSHMNEEMFHGCFPRWREFKNFMDPKISSDFARRVNLKCPKL